MEVKSEYMFEFELKTMRSHLMYASSVSTEYLEFTYSAGNWQRQPMVVNSSGARSLITLETYYIYICESAFLHAHYVYTDKWSGMSIKMYRMPLNTKSVDENSTTTHITHNGKKRLNVEKEEEQRLFWSTLLKASLFYIVIL